MTDAALAAQTASGKRRIKNYLLDARLQLKFTGYLVLISFVVGGALGAFLYRTTRSLFAESELAVKARSQAALLSKELGNAIVMKDLENADPSFQAKLLEHSRAIDAAYEREEKELSRAREELVRRQNITLWVLVGGFVAFLLFIAAAGIVSTHKIAGPLFRLKRLSADIGGGKLKVPHALRKGDELGDVFEAFGGMINSLRTQAADDLARVDGALERARALGDEQLVKTLETLSAKTRARLE